LAKGISGDSRLVLAGEDLSSDGPMALLIDDIHWSDDPSLRFLAYLADRAEMPVVLIVARRPGEAAGEPQTLRTLSSAPNAVILDGNPMLLTELLDDELRADRRPPDS
jgi:hypothetical protein